MSESKALVIAPRSFDEARQMASYVQRASMLPPELRGKESDVFMAIASGAELGLSPMVALRSIHIISGKPSLSADAMVAVVLGSGKCEYFLEVEVTAKHAVFETRRRGWPEGKVQRGSFSMDEAHAAGLMGNAMWKKYPQRMLKARAKAFLCRDVYPDLLAGIYDPDEAEEIAHDATEAPRHAPPPMTAPEQPTIDAEVVEDGPTLLERIDAATAEAELTALRGEVADLPRGSDERRHAAEAYSAALARVRGEQ